MFSSRKIMAVLAAMVLAGCAAGHPADAGSEPTDALLSGDTSKAASDTGNTESKPLPEPVPKPASGYDLFAWGRYNTKHELFVLNWYDEAKDSKYRLIDRNDNDRIIAELNADPGKNVSEYSFELKKNKASDGMTFRVERILKDGTTEFFDIVMLKNDEGFFGDSNKRLDSDGDGLTDIDETERKTDRLNPDTDGDGLPDKYEVYNLHTDPLKKRSAKNEDEGKDDSEIDIEWDGLTNLEEYRNGTNPYDGDCDDDGFPDGYEVKHGMDPITADELVIDKEKAAKIADLTEEEVQYSSISSYGLEIFDNEYGYIEQINGAFTDYQMENALDAMYLIYSVRTLLGIEDPSELILTRSDADNPTDHYQFGQYYNGVRVQAGYVMVSKSKLNGYTSIHSNYFPKEALAHIDTVPTIKEDELLDIAIAGADRTPQKIYEPELIIFKDYDSYKEDYDPTPFLAYQFTTDKHQGLIVDAHTGEIRHQGDTFIVG